MATNGNANAVPFKRTALSINPNKYLIAHYCPYLQGLTNDTASVESASILQDLSGHNNDLELKNFEWGANSGIGKYSGLCKFIHNNSPGISNVISNTYKYFEGEAYVISGSGRFVPLYYIRGSRITKDITVKIKSVTHKIQFANGYKDDRTIYAEINVGETKEFTIPGGQTYYHILVLCSNTTNYNIIIEEEPQYPGALCSYAEGFTEASTMNFNALIADTGFTLFVTRKYINKHARSVLTYKGGGGNSTDGDLGFLLEDLEANSITTNVFKNFTYSHKNDYIEDINKLDNLIEYYTPIKCSYATFTTVLTPNNTDGNKLYIFRSRDTYPFYSTVALWEYRLYNKAFDDNIIAAIKDEMMANYIAAINNTPIL